MHRSFQIVPSFVLAKTKDAATSTIAQFRVIIVFSLIFLDFDGFIDYGFTDGFEKVLLMIL